MTIAAVDSEPEPEPEPDLAPLPLADRPGFLVRRLHQIHVARFAEEAGAGGVTCAQYGLLVALAELGRGADQTTLAAAVRLDRTTAAGALQRLERRGLIERMVAPHDRRVRLCRLRPEGERMLARLADPARRASEALLGPLDAAERAVFVALLRRTVAAHPECTSVLPG